MVTPRSTPTLVAGIRLEIELITPQSFELVSRETFMLVTCSAGFLCKRIRDSYPIRLELLTRSSQSQPSSGIWIFYPNF